MSAGEPKLPDYDELPPAPRGGRSGWGQVGNGSQIGLMALQTPERVAAAARLVRTGEIFPLNAPITVPDPPMFTRGAPEHTLLSGSRAGYDDKIDNFYPQASSQWDSLAHVAYDADQFYNGVTSDDVRERRRNTIGFWAERGVAGRGVLIDAETALGGAGAGFSPGSARQITVEELDAARAAAGFDWQPGDVLVLHTGFLAWHMAQDQVARETMADAAKLQAVGLAHNEDMARYLWNAHVSAVVADNPSVEVWPPDRSEEAYPFGFLHRMLIGQFGIGLGELWWTDGLAKACRREGRYEFLFTAAPLNVPGGVGSPANALAIM